MNSKLLLEYCTTENHHMAPLSDGTLNGGGKIHLQKKGPVHLYCRHLAEPTYFEDHVEEL